MRGYLSDSQRKNFGTPIVREVIIKANNDARYDVSSTRYDASEALRDTAGVGNGGSGCLWCEYLFRVEPRHTYLP